jgi:23S rRNA (cytidine1920-2'-O)/16S rRNA (cytidine1409-2'-O)-methyltransferase
VVVHERCNIRTAQKALIEEACDVLVMDVSFISLRLVLPPALQYAKTDAVVVALVKPQFEVGPKDVGKGGIVKDPAAQHRALQDIVEVAAGLGIRDVRTLVSPILGAKGNREFLLVGRYLRA